LISLRSCFPTDIKKIDDDGSEFFSGTIDKTSELCRVLTDFLKQMKKSSDDIRVYYQEFIEVIDNYLEIEIPRVIKAAYTKQNISSFSQFLKDDKLCDALIKLDHMSKYVQSFSGLNNNESLRHEYERCQDEFSQHLTSLREFIVSDIYANVKSKPSGSSSAYRYVKIANSLRMLY